MKGSFRLKALLAVLLVGLLLAACQPQTITVVETIEVIKEVEGTPVTIIQTVEVVPTTSPTESPYDPNAPIVIWVDSTRAAATDLMLEANPEWKDLVTVEIGNASLPQRILLFNNIGEGWPDVVFAEPQNVMAVADAAHDYFAADLRPWIDPEIIDGYYPGSLAECTQGDELLCLRNDLAQDVLYYNVPLFEQFGYEVPTTWSEFEAIAEDVAANHPGYVMGAAGDFWSIIPYFWSSGCPASQVLSVAEVKIDLSDPKCVRAAKFVDKMVDLGVFLPVTTFDPAFIKAANENKLLTLFDASWYGEYIFGGKEDSLYYQTAEGQLGVAAPLFWEGEEKNYSAAHGGAAWMMSSKTKNPELAAKVVVWLATATEYHKGAPTFPAYQPAAEAWAETISNNPLYANDPFPIFADAAALIHPDYVRPRFDFYSPWSKHMQAALEAGTSLEEALPVIEEDLANLAAASGFRVVK